jgi:MoxR-like ATPase
MKVTHKKLERLMLRCYDKKLPLFIWGAPGIGKTDTVKKVSRQLADKSNRALIDWNSLTEDSKEDFVKDAEKIKSHFILFDTRASECDATDTKGIPNFTSDKRYLVWTNDIIWKVLEDRNSLGIVFFDEFNLAPPLIQSSFYKIIHDKKVGNISINPNIWICSAGNRSDDRAATYEMAAPLANRFCHCELDVPSVEDWSDWAANNEIDGRIIAFVNFRKKYLFYFNKDNIDKAYPTPRSWEFCSKLISGNKDELDAKESASITVSDGVATEFDAFNRLSKKFDMKKIFDDPEKVSIPESIDEKYAITYAVAEHYAEHKDVLPKVVTISERFGPEFGILLLRLCKTSGKTAFMTKINKVKQWTDVVAKKYAKYLEGDDSDR